MRRAEAQKMSCGESRHTQHRQELTDQRYLSRCRFVRLVNPSQQKSSTATAESVRSRYPISGITKVSGGAVAVKARITNFICDSSAALAVLRECLSAISVTEFDRARGKQSVGEVRKPTSALCFRNRYQHQPGYRSSSRGPLAQRCLQLSASGAPPANTD